MRGPAEAPPVIREAFHSESGNLCVEDGRDLATDRRWHEVGDVPIADTTKAFDQIESAVSELLDCDAKVIALGGDHSVTIPVMRAFARKYGKLNVLHLDAHPDLYDQLDGNEDSHATPFYRCFKEGLIGHLVQVGIRSATPLQRAHAKQFGVEMIEIRRWRPGPVFGLNPPLYLSLDLDCLDPAFAPGVSHHEPGGFSTRDVVGIIQNLRFAPIGADIVELNPSRDPSGITAMAAAKLLKELLGRMLR
jgi:agmatinase